MAIPSVPSPLRVLGLTLALVAALGAVWWQGRESEPARRFCTAEGLIGPGTEGYHRDPDQDCAWVDGDGNPTTTSTTTTRPPG
jgi:hypothetical protein